MGTITAPKGKRSAKHLQVSEQMFGSYLKQDSTQHNVYGRGTGRAPAVESDPHTPDIMPLGHNIIGLGSKFEETEYDHKQDGTEAPDD